MNIQYLGTAAAEGYPAIFCQCERCRIARRLGGRNVRGRASALIDGKILIDCGPDTFMNSVRFGIDYTNIKTLLVTHVHSDHFHLPDLTFRRPGFAYFCDAPKLTVYGSPDIDSEELRAAALPQDAMYGYTIKVQKPFESFVAEGYTITPLKANHGTENPYNYLIEKDGKALLYAHDTGLFLQETLDYLKNCGVKLDLVSMDCTMGTNVINFATHMNVERNLQMREKLKELGVVDDATTFVVNHFSHNGENTLHEDITAIAKSYGMLASYDGLVLEW